MKALSQTSFLNFGYMLMTLVIFSSFLWVCFGLAAEVKDKAIITCNIKKQKGPLTRPATTSKRTSPQHG